MSAVSAAADDDELDDQKAAAVETAMNAPETVADFDLGAYHAKLARDGGPTVCLITSVSSRHCMYIKRAHARPFDGIGRTVLAHSGSRTASRCRGVHLGQGLLQVMRPWLCSRNDAERKFVCCSR